MRMKISSLYSLSEMQEMFNQIMKCIDRKDGPIQPEACALFLYPDVFLKHKDDYIFPGEAHSYSHVFPFTHVTRNSQWVNNGTVKDKFMEDIFEEFKIDRTIRGMFIH